MINKKSLTLLLILSFLSYPVFAGYDEALKYYQDGEIKKSLDELQPLIAEKKPEAQELLGWIMLPNDPKNALITFEFAAEQNMVNAQVQLGYMYAAGVGTTKNCDKSFYWYERAAKFGDADAQFSLGYIYSHGCDEITQNYKLAANWFKKAARQGHVKSKYELAILYYEGRGVTKDLKKALKLALFAAKNGLADAQYDVGRAYFYGDVGPINYDKGMKFLLMASEKNHYSAQLLIAAYYQYFGDKLKAENFYKLAIKNIYSQVGAESNDYIKALAHLGGLYAENMKYQEAKELSLIGLKTCETKKYSDCFAVWTTLGTAYVGLLMANEAEMSFYKAIALYEEGSTANHEAYLLTLNNLGNLYNEIGRTDDAKKIIQLALTKYKKLEESNQFTQVDAFNRVNSVLHFNLGLAQFSLNDLGKAEASFRKSLSISEELYGNKHIKLQGPLFLLGQVAAGSQRYEEAIKILSRALNLSPNDDVSTYMEANISYFLGLIYHLKGINTGNENLAKALVTKSFKYFEENLGPNNPNLVRYLLTSATLETDIDIQLTMLRRGVELMENYFDKKNKNQLINQKTIRIKADNIYNAYAGLTLLNALQANNAESKEEAFKALQIAQNSLTSEAMFSMTTRMATGSSVLSRMIRKQQDYEMEQEHLNQKLVKLTISEKEDMPVKLKLFNELNLLNRKIEANFQEIMVNFPDYAELIGNAPLALNLAKKELDENQVLFNVWFSEFSKDSYVFLTRKNVSMVYKLNLGKNELSEKIYTIRSGLDLSNTVNIQTLPKYDLNLAYSLHQEILGPAKDFLKGVDHFLIVPSGPLGSLPLSILLTEPLTKTGTDIQNYKSAAWFSKSYSVTTLPSISSLRVPQYSNISKKKQTPFMGFGDPILNGKRGAIRGLKIIDLYTKERVDIEKLRALPELPETSGELRSIAQYLKVNQENLFLRERATEKNVKLLDLSKSKVIAFATHGLLTGEISNLTEPALVLTPPQIVNDDDDGLLKASEIALLKLNADWILLSACNTASGQTLEAEGLSGLARAFIYAGARSLLVSHWSVDSVTAAQLTTGIFEELEKNPNIGKAKALQLSMLKLLSDEDHAYYAHPAFWAPFSFVGGTTLNN